MLDEMELRSCKIHVERAKFEVKGTFNPELKRKRKKMIKNLNNNRRINYLIGMNVQMLFDINMNELLC